jgi:signal transduction histidine kinase
MSLRARLLVAFLLPALAVLSLGGFLLYRASRDVLEEELGAALARVAASVAAQVKAERVLPLTPEDAEGEGSRTFRSVQTQLTEVRERTQLRRILFFDLSRRALIDAGGGLPPRAEVPELLRDGAEVARVLQGRPAASQVLFEGRDGQLYKTGYAPLLQEGKVVGAVAVEGTAAFFVPLQALRNAFLGLAGVMLLLLGAAALASAEALKRPLDRLVGSALRIGGGDLLTSVPPEGRWELGILAGELEAMRLALEGRDRQLKLMLGGVAHEVKNPLGGIELFAGLLDEELRSPRPELAEASAHLERIRRELAYLKRIVEDFLVFAREQKLNAAPFDARGLLEAVAAHLTGEAQARGVAVEVQAIAATLLGDQGLLTSALLNLAKNAVQASKPGQSVSLSGAARGEAYVIEVVDRGPGIPAALVERIFEPFFTTREQGTGLGLPLAKKLIEVHRGTLTVESAPGRTKFEVVLPQL